MDLQKELQLLSDVLNDELDYYVSEDAQKKAADALGSIATDFCINTLHEFIQEAENADSEVLAAVVSALGWAVERRHSDLQETLRNLND